MPPLNPANDVPADIDPVAQIDESKSYVPPPKTKIQYGRLRINWPQALLIVLSPIAAIYGIMTTQITLPTVIWTVIYYFITGTGITAGYHRLWAHRSYNGRLPLRIYLALAGSGAYQGSIRWWSRGHRAHHRYTDTDLDPYGVHRGMLWAHIGWLLFHAEEKKLARTESSDLDKDPVVQWQHRNYKWLAPFMAFVLPTLVAGFGWGDWRGGYFYAGILRQVCVHHATFCVNSLAHYFGDQSYDDLISPRDHIITALITFGEGYHNFHHEFPNDYRNAIRWYQYDPTKWLIAIYAFFGQAYNLRRFPENEVRKGRVIMKEKEVIEEKKAVYWGPAKEKLPRMSFSEFQRMCKEEGHQWLVIDGFIHDFTDFASNHPGGERMIRSGRGRDVTQAFNGGVHMHRNAARNLLTSLRIGVIDDGQATSSD